MSTHLIQSKTGQRPAWPYGINYASEEARGLRVWVPAGDGPLIDLVGNSPVFPAYPSGGYVLPTGMTRPLFPMMPFIRSGAGTPGYRVYNGSMFDVNKWTTGVTFSLWVLIRASGSHNIINVLQAGSNTIRCQITYSTGSITCTQISSPTPNRSRVTSTVFAGGSLVNLVTTIDNTTGAGAGIRIYFNGIEALYSATTDAGGTVQDASGQIAFGSSATAGTLDGNISDFRIYDYIMTPPEVMAFYQRTQKWDLYRTKAKLVLGTSPPTFSPFWAVQSNQVLPGPM